MSGVSPAESGHIKRLYEYRCSCGWGGDLRVRIAARDRQRCPECRVRLERVPHFRTVGFRVPGYMKSSHDVQDTLPDDPGEREAFLKQVAEEHAYAPGLLTPSGLVQK